LSKTLCIANFGSYPKGCKVIACDRSPGWNTLGLSVLEHIRPMIETVVLEQAAEVDMED
jgi:hypothetical protein